MTRWLLLVALLALAMTAVGAGNADAPNPPDDPQFVPNLRDGANSEQWDDPDFEKFYDNVLGALARRDATAMALLTSFPLHVHYCDGSSVALENERALLTRFDEAFPAWLRAEVIGRAKTDEDSTVWRGEIGLAHGLIWVKRDGKLNTSRLRVYIVNACEHKDKEQATAPIRLRYVCETEKHRIVIDVDKDNTPSYRAWNKPRFLPDAPDITIRRGDWHLEGTSGCAGYDWSFVQGKTTITVSELKCTGGTDAPPDDAKAQVVVSTGGKPQKMWWCY